VIDKRIFPLLETLAESNLDWLVKEILAAIEQGASQIESEDAIILVQAQVRRNDDVRSEGEEQAKMARSRPLEGNEQVELAAELVVSRVKESLHMAKQSIVDISRVIGERKGESAFQSVESVVLLGDDEEIEASINKSDIEHALGELDRLRLAVDQWKSESLSRDQEL